MKRGLTLALLVARLSLGATAFAGFGASATVPANTFSAARLERPTDLAADVSCGMPGAPADVNLAWTDTTSGFADGADVLRSSEAGGQYARIAHVGAGSTTYTDQGITSADLIEGSTLFYVVRATAASWTSAFSNEAMAAVGLMCGL